MLNKIFKRLLWGVLCALLLSFITITTSQAQQAHPSGTDTAKECLDCHENTADDCVECHQDTVTAWQESTHGQAMSNEAFHQQWLEQGEPRDCLTCHSSGFDPETGEYLEAGVACSICHLPSPNHPDQIMHIDSSSELCGTCHLETFAEWQESAHGEGDMTCVNCHNPHTNTIKEENVGTLCQTCHTDEGTNYNKTAHAEEGLLCTDCHLRVSGTPLGEGHAQRSHTFVVDLETCNECHVRDMHYPSDNEAVNGTGVHESGTGDSPLSNLNDGPAVELNPSSISPINLVVLTAILGLAFGFVGSPLLERWFQKVKGGLS